MNYFFDQTLKFDNFENPDLYPSPFADLETDPWPFLQPVFSNPSMFIDINKVSVEVPAEETAKPQNQEKITTNPDECLMMGKTNTEPEQTPLPDIDHEKETPKGMK